MAREDDYPGLALSPSGAAPSAFIVHHTAGRGDPESVVNFWKKQGKGYGSQYIMDRNGVIHDTAKEFGYTGTNEILNDSTHKLSNANTVGMEIVANDDKDVTPQQANAFAQFIAARYPNTPLFGHGQVNPGHKEATEGATALNAALALRSQAGQPVLGTAINTPNAPISGALAKQETGPESAGQGAPMAASTGPQDLRQILYNKLIATGLQPHQALGALYSLGGESSTFNTGAYNPNDPGGSIGIGQWNGIRRTRLEDYAKEQGKAWTDPNVQADFLIGSISDPKHPDYQPGVLDALKKTGNAADATNVFTAQFERPKVNNWQQRFDAGPTRIGALDQNNNFALGSGPSSNTTAPGTAVAAAPAADQPLWSRFVNPPVDAQGKPVEGAKSPLEQAVATITGGPSEKTTEALKAAAPQRSALEMGAPGARNVSLGLAPGAAQQVWGQTLNSFMQPLTWSSAPPGTGMGPVAGYQGYHPAGAAPAVPGTSLASVPYSALDPNFGAGFQFGG